MLKAITFNKSAQLPQIFEGTNADPQLKGLMRHFLLTPKGIACRYYDLPDLKIGFESKKYVYPGQRISPIVLGALEDLSFYSVWGPPGKDRDEPGPAGVEMFFLEKYLLIPTRSGKLVFVCDDHTHAAFAWALARETGIINDRATLIHIDEHLDNDRVEVPYIVPPGDIPFLEHIAKSVWETLEICNFIFFAAQPEADIIDNDSIYYVKPTFNNRRINRYTNYWDAGNPADKALLNGTKLSLELVGEILLTKKTGKSIICDIDLDFFERYYGKDGNLRKVNDFSLDDSLAMIVKAAKQSDFITVATSPSHLLVPNQMDVTHYLLRRIVSALDQ